MSDDTPSPLNNVITIDDERIPSARTVDATDIGSQHPARYGQNRSIARMRSSPVMTKGRKTRAHAVGLGGREHGQQTRGLRRRNPRKKVKPSESCGRKAAY